MRKLAIIWIEIACDGHTPRGGEGELAVRRDHDVVDEVGVTLEGPLGLTVVVLIAGEVPHEQGLVCKQ